MMIENNDFMKILKSRDSDFYSIIQNVYKEIESLLDQRIAYVFPKYTQHDTKHSKRIIEHMEKIVPNIDELNDLEIAILLLSALLHDVGMAASDEEIENIKLGTLKYNNIKYKALLNKFNGNETEAIQEYIRKVHAERSSYYIKENLNKKLVLPEMPEKSFADIVALVCEAHTKDILWLKNNVQNEYKIGKYELAPQFYAIVLRIADILDFDGMRTPQRLFNAINLTEYSKEEWKQHFSIENTDKIKIAEDGKKYIEFYGICSEPIIHRKVLSYIDWVNYELTNAIEITKELAVNYRLNFYHKVIDKINSKKYSIVDLKFQMNYKNTINLLMGEALYGDRKIGLRELIQNSIDACLLLKEIKANDVESEYDEYNPRIYIILDKGNGIVKIKDNGKGMDIYTIKNYFLEIGASYFMSDDFLLSGYEYNPIGNYGIGFLASFMLSETVKVRTREYRDSNLSEIDIYKDNEYVSIRKLEDTQFNGTEIILDYQEFFNVFEDKEDIIEYIYENFLIKDFEIIIDDKEDKKRVSLKQNEGRNKSQTIISLSKYLDDIDAEIILPNEIQNYFFQYLDEILDAEHNYSFDGSTLRMCDKEPIPIKDYLQKDTIQIVSFMNVEDSSGLYELIELENEMFSIDAEEEYKSKYDSIETNIVISPNIPVHNFKGKLHEVDEIVNGLKFELIEEIDEDFYHENEYGTYFYDYKINIFSVEGIEKVLHLTSSRGAMGTRVFIRNVYVSDIVLHMPNAIIHNQSKKIKSEINIFNRKIMPNVTRKELLNEDKKLISNSINQALYLHFLEQTNNKQEQIILSNYIKRYHNYEKSLLKKEYIEKIKYFL
ncbi:HD domain-containing protein [Lysinibacillus tabacifolii]|nr:ATP-binding protein [Lysinibacillus tabacifolii]